MIGATIRQPPREQADNRPRVPASRIAEIPGRSRAKAKAGLPRFAVAAVSLFAALGLSIAAANTAGQGAPAPDLAPQQASQPFLMTGGKVDTNVYLQSLDIEVEVTGNIASTRYTMVFRNRTSRDLEGELTFPLPDGVTVTHHALDINGRMREAVPVEKARATQAFEEIQQRRQVIDPSILERVEGNNFRTRIYPFPRNGTRTISVGYEEELALENGLLHYRLPMAYANPIEKFSVKATVWMSELKPIVPDSEDMISFDRAGENYVASFTRQNYRPSRALDFALPAPAGIPQVLMQQAQGDFYFLASIAPGLETRKKTWGNDLAIIWDVSLSGSQRDLYKEMEALDIIFNDKRNVNVNLYFLNNRFCRIINKNSSNGAYNVINGNWNALKMALETAVFDGGTDYSQIKPSDIAGSEILFFSDGLSTLGDADFLRDERTGRPIHCVVSSSTADYSTMRSISGKTNGKFVNINALSSDRLKNELLNETPQFLGVEYDSSAIREVYPSVAAPARGNFSIAGITGRGGAEMTLLFGFGNRVEKRIKVQLDARNADHQGNVYRIWAQKKIAELDLDFDRNRAELTELGRRFGIVTRNTSLIVLELVTDYVLFNIEPPASEPELRAQYNRRQRGSGEQRRSRESGLLAAAVSAARKIGEWRKAGFRHPPLVPADPSAHGDLAPDTGRSTTMAIVKSAYDPDYLEGDFDQSGEAGDAFRGWGDARNLLGGLVGPPGNQLNLKKRGAIRTTSPQRAEFLAGGSLSGGAGGGVAAASDGRTVGSLSAVTVRPVRRDREYLNFLTGNLADDYQAYLKIRNNYAASPTFYFDMADWFYRHGDREAALRILTSIADLELENASLYRMLGYRLKEYGEYALQKFVCRKVIEWRPMEPQSYRDYALAMADNGEDQAALDALYGTLTRQYPINVIGYSLGIEEAVIMEINRLIAKNPRLDISRIDSGLLVDAPVDIRVVINWNANNTDVNLSVNCPFNERLFSGSIRPATHIGAHTSVNDRSGYGPEQYILRNAARGRYQIFAERRSARAFASNEPVTVMAEIYTKYAGADERRQVVCLQLPDSSARGRDGMTLVAEFDFGDDPPPAAERSATIVEKAAADAGHREEPDREILKVCGAGTVGDPWDCGANPGTVRCVLGNNGTLMVSGNGAMLDYSTNVSGAWFEDDIRNAITAAVIENGVTTVGDWAFSGCVNMKTVRIPASVTGIGEGAFDGCAALTAIVIPNGVTKIGNSAFYGGASLTSVSIPNSVAELGAFAFAGCAGLRSAAIGGGLTKIEHAAFEGCAGLTSVTIPNGVVEIGSKAFGGCIGLASVSIPNSVTELNDRAFEGCTGLASVTVGSGLRKVRLLPMLGSFPNLTAINVNRQNQAYSSADGVLYSKSGKTLLLFPRGRRGAYTVPAAVRRIDEMAFEGCAGLTSLTVLSADMILPSRGVPNFSSITLGRNVTVSWELNNRWLDGNPNLTSIRVDRDNRLYRSVDGVLFNKSADTLLLFPRGRRGAYTVPGGVKHIFDRAFSGSAGLTSVTIPASVTGIGWGAFGDNAGLALLASLNPVPPEINEMYAFYSLIDTACLYVPAQSADLYRGAPGWSNFYPANVRPAEARSGGGAADRPQGQGQTIGEAVRTRTNFGIVGDGRSRGSIMRGLITQYAGLRRAYNMRLRDKPDLAGQIVVRFAIDEFGTVTFVRVIQSTMGDPELERTVTDAVNGLRFERVDRPGAITGVTYTFHFSQ